MELIPQSEASSCDNSINLTHVFRVSFVSTRGEMSDRVGVFFHSKGNETLLGTRLLAKSIRVMRENMWKLVYRFLAIMDLMAQTIWMCCEIIAILPQPWGGETEFLGKKALYAGEMRKRSENKGKTRQMRETWNVSVLQLFVSQVVTS